MNNERTVENCLATLRRNGVKVNTDEKKIPHGNYGIGTWAVIDCLTHYHGYILVY